MPERALRVGGVRGLRCPRPRHRRLLGAGGPAPWGAADGGRSGYRWRATSPAVLGQAPGPCRPALLSPRADNHQAILRETRPVEGWLP